MAHPNVDLLNKGYDAFDKGDLDALRDLFSQDVVFHIPGDSQISGDFRGQDEVFAFFGKLVELSGGTFRLERHAVLADDEHGTVMHTITAERDGKTLSQKGVDIHHISGGKVTEFWGFTEDTVAANQFWS